MENTFIYNMVSGKCLIFFSIPITKYLTKEAQGMKDVLSLQF